MDLTKQTIVRYWDAEQVLQALTQVLPRILLVHLSKYPSKISGSHSSLLSLHLNPSRSPGMSYPLRFIRNPLNPHMIHHMIDQVTGHLTSQVLHHMISHMTDHTPCHMTSWTPAMFPFSLTDYCTNSCSFVITHFLDLLIDYLLIPDSPLMSSLCHRPYP